MAFHPELGWAISPESYSDLYNKFEKLQDLSNSRPLKEKLNMESQAEKSTTDKKVIKHQQTVIDALERQIYDLREKIKKLEHQAFLKSWEDNPDGMGR